MNWPKSSVPRDAQVMRHMFVIMALELTTSIAAAQADDQTGARRPASTPPTCDTQTSAKARKLFQQALKDSGQERYEDAIAGFEQAYALCPKTLILFNIATACWASGQRDKALRLYQRLTAEQPASKYSDKARAAVRDMVEEAETLLGTSGSGQQDDGQQSLARDGDERADDARRYEDALHVYEAYLQMQLEPERKARVEKRVTELRATLKLRSEQRRDAAQRRQQMRLQQAWETRERKRVTRAQVRRKWYLAGSWTGVGVTLLALGGAAVSGVMTQQSTADKDASVTDYQRETGMTLSSSNACNDAENRLSAGEPDVHLTSIVASCDKGRRSAFLSTVSIGVALGGIGVTTILLHLAYSQRVTRRAWQAAEVTLQPAVSREALGVSLTVAF